MDDETEMELRFIDSETEKGRKVDPCGIPYDRTGTRENGSIWYERDYALGGGQGSSYWTSEHDCNPTCGHHLAAKCTGCGVCTSCDGCYCGEGEWGS